MKPIVGVVPLLLLTGCAAPTLFPESRSAASTAADATAAPATAAGPGASAGTPSPTPLPSAGGSPSAGSTADGFARAYEEFAATLPADTGIAVTAVGTGDPVQQAGSRRTGVAWSTIKVPLAIAATGRGADDSIRAAIVDSDNSAADDLWRSLGTPETAAATTARVIDGLGGGTVPVQSRVTRPGLSASGQTEWSVESQARFTAHLPCTPAARQVYDYMGHTSGSQQWGIANLRGAHLKGGWGPDPDGRYLVRQIGTFDTSRGSVAVAIAVAPHSGAFADGTAVLSRIGAWLAEHQEQLPAGRCG
ncbi:hypothetical protein [Granulicoccus phenolivorans]|uniref:hypothetical protein n=1 Tax=Granulicoccus phenolivorans TaxID=266854 RepID=UPI0004025CBB|nr:hypothetical protein [Granulicoccus phenolivorans]